MALTFEEDIRRVLSNIPRGTVLTYGEVAEESGHPGASRAVGNLLAHGDGALPWWRVVTVDRTTGPRQRTRTRKRLSAEGVRVTNGHVDMGARQLLRGRAVKRGDGLRTDKGPATTIAADSESLDRLLEHLAALREHPSNEVPTGVLVVVKDRARDRDDAAPLREARDRTRNRLRS